MNHPHREPDVVFPAHSTFPVLLEVRYWIEEGYIQFIEDDGYCYSSRFKSTKKLLNDLNRSAVANVIPERQQIARDFLAEWELLRQSTDTATPAPPT